MFALVAVSDYSMAKIISRKRGKLLSSNQRWTWSNGIDNSETYASLLEQRLASHVRIGEL